jgi:hypothetical protein
MTAALTVGPWRLGVGGWTPVALRERDSVETPGIREMRGVGPRSALRSTPLPVQIIPSDGDGCEARGSALLFTIAIN